MATATSSGTNQKIQVWLTRSVYFEADFGSWSFLCVALMVTSYRRNALWVCTFKKEAVLKEYLFNILLELTTQRLRKPIQPHSVGLL